MPIVKSEFALSRDSRVPPQLATRAIDTLPAWLWRADGSRILWANAVGAAIFGSANAGGSVERRFEPGHPAAAEISRLALTLPQAGVARLERLRGFGASFGRALTCVCSRLALADGGTAILVVATEPAGPALTLRERVSRILSGRPEALAAFAPDGTALYANDAARIRFDGTPVFAASGIADITAQALSDERASGTTARGAVTIERLGSDSSTVLVATFGAEPAPVRTPSIEPANAGAAIAAAPSQGLVETPTLVPAAEPMSSAPATAQSNGADAHHEPALERRHPLRFVWQMDADGRFVVGSDEFAELTGPRTTAAFGRLWSDVAADLKLDPDGQVARALATRETWSGITVSWPVDDAGERLPVEMSGLPVFDRERKFCGYRGFGVCRDIDRINQLLRARREQPTGFMTGPEFSPQGEVSTAAAVSPSVDTSNESRTQPDATFDGAAPRLTGTTETGTNEAASGPLPSPEQTVPSGEQSGSVAAPAATPANVVPFRSGIPTEPKPPSLSPVEHKAFRQLAQELTARLGGARETFDQDTGGGENAAAAEVADDASAAFGAESGPAPARAGFEGVLLDRLPIGVLIYQQEHLLYANRYFLELGGYPDIEALAAAGGLTALFAPAGAGAPVQADGAQSLSVMTKSGDRRPVEGRLFSVPWGGGTSALALVLLNGAAEERRRTAASSLGKAEDEIRQLRAKLDSHTVAEDELRTATREAQKAAAAKADFLGKVSHEIRTPLNAITGFTELILAERFGPIGNDRYRDYLKDVHAAGLHLVSLLNDLLDLSRIETGQLDLNFASISLNDLTRQCVGIMQPQASRARIIIRTALAPALPQVVADERSLRQIVLNLLSHSIRFTGPGGQVIVSTAFADNGEAVLRVRDTGVGMSEKDVEAALEPFRQSAVSGSWGSGGTGLGLPLTKALAEANRAHFSITSAPNAGTLVEVAFPPARVVAH